MKKCPYCGKEYLDTDLVCLIDQFPLEPRNPMPPEPLAEARPPVVEEVVPVATPNSAPQAAVEPDGFIFLANLDAFEANRLLKKFQSAAIRFQIDRVEARVLASRGYRTTSSIEIFVHHEDHEQATKIFRADWQV